MDRDKRWERVTLGLRGDRRRQRRDRATTPTEAVDKGYAAGHDDEFVKPTVIDGYAGMKDGDGLLMFNFRADRARQILTALLDPRFDGFNRAARREVRRGRRHGRLFGGPQSVPARRCSRPRSSRWAWARRSSKAGLKQLRIAETEKYAHVTFFFNGGEERVFEGEERILVPSPKVATYDLKPEMSAPEVTDKLVEAIGSGKFDLIVVNYANTDMVGHTGNLAAAIKAVEAVDACLGRLMEAVKKAGGALLVTADHGNAEQMFDEKSHQKHTAAHAEPRAGAAVRRPGQHPFAGRRQAGRRRTHHAGADGPAAARGNDRPFAACRKCRARSFWPHRRPPPQPLIDLI